MNQVVVYLALVLIGACLGSFAGATVWRLRARQLVFDKKNKQPYDKAEYRRLKPLTTSSTLEDRSQCLHCGYKLRWYDLIPVLSWLGLKGKCRSCKKPIGWFELLMELGTIAFFVVSYLFWPHDLHTGLQIAHFVLWLAAGVGLAILFAYDTKWFLLPDSVVAIVGLFGLASVAVSAAESQAVGATLVGALGAVGALGGLYGILYAVSGGRWVGFGDVKLGVVLGLLLGQWQLSLVALFMANFIGCLIVIPLLAAKKLQRTSHIPFGPLLIAGTVVAWLWGWQLINWYLASAGF